ncbi:MAG: RHS repeat-associated core domain-containing protein, partial [Chthonomonadales bacterium]|nr:RHS repeat-associated core domain-containing protein [Chthonomonadales bacterium]
AAGYQHVPFTGLYHVGAREYDPRTARWLQRDPIGQSSGDPNLYRYCLNDAVNLSDPSGLQPPDSPRATILQALKSGDVKEAIALFEGWVITQQGVAKIAPLALMILGNPATVQGLQQAVSRLPATVPYGLGKLPECKEYAYKVWDYLTRSGVGENTTIKVVRMENALGTKLPIPLSGGKGFFDNGNHYFVQWGDVVIDSMTGPKGQSFNEWIKRFQYVESLSDFSRHFKLQDVPGYIK